MELVAVVVHILRSTVAPRRGKAHIPLAHGTPFGTCILTNLHRLGVNAEHKLSSVNDLCCGLTNVLDKQTDLFSALVELATGDEIGNGIGTLVARTGKKIVFTIDTECFGCDGKSHNLQIRESGDYTTVGDISLLIDLISCILLADFKEFWNFAMKLRITMIL